MDQQAERTREDRECQDFYLRLWRAPNNLGKRFLMLLLQDGGAAALECFWAKFCTAMETQQPLPLSLFESTCFARAMGEPITHSRREVLQLVGGAALTYLGLLTAAYATGRHIRENDGNENPLPRGHAAQCDPPPTHLLPGMSLVTAGLAAVTFTEYKRYKRILDLSRGPEGSARLEKLTHLLSDLRVKIIQLPETRMETNPHIQPCNASYTVNSFAHR